jgi:type I restriction enzyme R subunit
LIYLSAKARDRVKEVAQNLIEAIKAELHKLDNWRDKDTTKAQIETFIYDYLYSEETGLPIEAYDEPEIKPLADVIFLHIYHQYASSVQSPYSDVA